MPSEKLKAMADQEQDQTMPSSSWLHLVSAFLTMEPPDVLISLARVCGGGSMTQRVQSFIWNHCINKADEKFYAPYVKGFLKKLIIELESIGAEVLDELYEQYVFYITSLKDNDSARGNSRVLKQISFLFDGHEIPTWPRSRPLVVPIQCSLNMLKGDTGCSIWPSSLFLSELILSFPEIFTSKSCFEVGSGVGLVGICLAHVKASKVILSDGDLSSLANMKLNLELNQLCTKPDLLERATPHLRLVQCIHLPWESVLESEILEFKPDIVLAADVIYDPSCLPHLVRVLLLLLNRDESYSHDNPERTKILCNNELNEAGSCGDDRQVLDARKGKGICNTARNAESPSHAVKERPVAYIASVIRNIDTFNYFLTLADQASLLVTDITEKIKPFNLLPYLKSYDRSSIRLFTISYLCD